MSLVILLRSAAALCCFFILSATAASAHVLVPFRQERNTHSLHLARSADGRVLDVPLRASGHVFVADVKVGTPPQSLSLLLSPSSPHTWVPKAEGMPCANGYEGSLAAFYSPSDGSISACKWGSYNTAKSSTAKTVDNKFVNFAVAYTSTINVVGVNVTDKLVIGDVELDDFAMGLVTSVSNQQWIGMLGLGNDPEMNFVRPSAKYRPNLIDQLVSTGKINSQAYSIWLNPQGTSGSLLLGAIDTSRFEGEMVRLNAAQQNDAVPSAFGVSLASVNVEGTSKDFKYTEPSISASISPAETFSYLPDELAESIMAATGASWNTSLQRATIPCDAGSKNSKATLRFQLEGPGGPVLNARLADLVVPQEVTRWELAFDKLTALSRNTCLFGIQRHPDIRATSRPQYNLGSALLRRTYMVFDVANKDVAFAPINPNTTVTPAIVPFDKRGARIPSSRLYCAAGGDCPETSVFVPSDSDADHAAASAPNTSWKTIVPAVLVPVIVLAILVPVAYLLITRRRRRQQLISRATTTTTNSSPSTKGEETDDGEDSSYRDDEFGVKVTVSVSSKVQVAKPPSPPEVFLGLPASMPIIPEEKGVGGPSGSFWGESLVPGGLSPRGASSGSGGSDGVSDISSRGRKEIWEERK